MAQQTGNAPDPLAQLGVPATPSTPAAPADPLAAIGTPATPPPAAAEQPSIFDRGVNALKNVGSSILSSAVTAAQISGVPIPIKPPETPTEQVVQAHAGDSGLAAYRAAKGLVGSVENVVKSGPEAYANAVKDYQRAHQEFVNHDYRNAASSAASAVTDAAHIVEPTMGTNDARQLTEGTRPGADLTTPLVTQGTNAALALAGTFAPEVLGAGSEAADATASGVRRMIMNPFRRTLTEDAVQPELQANLKNTWNKVADDNNVPRPTATSIRDYGEQVADAILARSKTLYRAVDEATGNRFSGTAAKLQNVVQKMRTVTTDAEEQALLIEKTRYEMQIDQMFDEAAQAATGVTKRTVEAAKAQFKKAQAIYDANQDVRMSTKGIRPGDPGAEGSPETVNSSTLQNRLNKRQDSGRLAEGVGDANGKQMIGHTGKAEATSAAAKADEARVAKNVGRVKAVAKGAALAVGGHEMIEKAKELVTPATP